MDNTKQKLDKDRDLMAEKLKQIENLQYEVDLIKEHTVSTIKNIVDACTFVDFHKIWKDLDMFPKDAKQSKDVLQRIQNNYFFDDKYKAKLTQVYIFGFDETGYEFEYKIDKLEFQIFVPIFKNANVENFANNMYYQLFHKDTESSYTLIYQTRDLEEFKPQVEKWLDSKLAEKQGV